MRASDFQVDLHSIDEFTCAFAQINKTIKAKQLFLAKLNLLN